MAFLVVESVFFLSIVDIFHKRAGVKSMTTNQIEKGLQTSLGSFFLSLGTENIFSVLWLWRKSLQKKEWKESSITAIVKESAGEMARKGSGSWLIQMFCHFFPYTSSQQGQASFFFSFKDAFKVSRMLSLNETNGLCCKTCCFVDLQASRL